MDSITRDAASKICINPEVKEYISMLNQRAYDFEMKILMNIWGGDEWVIL
jgi:hypothetical protein